MTGGVIDSSDMATRVAMTTAPYAQVAGCTAPRVRRSYAATFATAASWHSASAVSALVLLIGIATSSLRPGSRIPLIAPRIYRRDTARRSVRQVWVRQVGFLGCS